jgi:16S rRNA processing protein RimM
MEGCDDRNAAALLRGKAVAVPRASLPAEPAQEYYWADLIGLRVVNAVEQEFGRVTAVMQTGANDVLVVEDGRERLIPFIAPVIREVDPVAGVIRVDWDPDY